MKTFQIALYFLAVSLLGPYQRADAADPAHSDYPMIPPTEALSRLKEGNSRFISGNVQHPHESSDERAYIAKYSYENPGAISLGMTSEQAAKRRGELTKSQHPFAIILSCSDSRVPLDTMIKANVKHVVDALRSSKPILKTKVDSGDVQVVGGYYTLDTGAVTFLDGK